MSSITATRSTFTTIACVGISLLLPASSVFATPRKKAKPVPQVQPISPAPAPELTPAQKPAVPPQVTFNNGELTIVAENCTIGDVMRAVHSQTGAVIDLPPNASERVVSRVGPGAPRDVLVSLLNGSNFNYVILGVATDPKAVKHVILTAKAMSVGSSDAMANAQPNTGQPGMANDVSESENNEPAEAEESQEDQSETPTEEQPAAEATPQQPGVKTPEQLLQELQRQQVLQQQQQQGQSQGAGPSSFPQADQPNQVPQNPPQD